MSAPAWIAPRFEIELAYSAPGVIEYIGWTEPGNVSSDPFWVIVKLLYSGTDIASVRFADHNRNFDKVWDDRATYNYA